MPPPQHCPRPRELDDLELLLSGALHPRTGFDADGPVSLELPEGVTDVELVDPEGLPLARVEDGVLTALGEPAYGAFRGLHRTPAQVHQEHPDALTVPVHAPLTEEDLALIERSAAERPVLLLALCGHRLPATRPETLVRATLAAARLLPDASVVAVPLPSHGDSAVDEELARVVTGNYAPGEILRVPGLGALPEPVGLAVAADQTRERGVVVFFTGLSGSGKSTLARALLDRLLESGERTVTSLDGDVVRRHLSAGLGFSREDRETNIRRIGWVAAEIARHHGVAICSPIAPFEETRAAVREMVEDAGGEFVLVHVATPLEECERRDRKGLYARARAGEIPDFTGISSPYDEPTDAAVRVDTTGRGVPDVLAEILTVLPFESVEPTSTVPLTDQPGAAR